MEEEATALLPKFVTNQVFLTRAGNVTAVVNRTALSVRPVTSPLENA